MAIETPRGGGAELDAEELLRYARQLALPAFGTAAQRRLKQARVLLVGAGGLGSAAGLYLAAAGVGRIAIVEPDRVDVSNLQRQVLHATADVGRPKLHSAIDRLRALNPGVELVGHEARLDAASARDLVRAHDVAVDATDNTDARYALSDACVAAGRPLVHASAEGLEGQATVFTVGGPCYRCLYPEPAPARPSPLPILGAVAGLLGTIEAVEAVKLLTGLGEPLSGRLLLVDALSMRFHQVAFSRDPGCPACGTGRS